MRERLVEWFHSHASSKWFLLSGAVGVVAGLSAVALQLLTHLILSATLGDLAGYYPAEPIGEHRWFDYASGTAQVSIWMVVGVVTFGGLVSGLLVYFAEPEAAGSGTNSAIDAYHNRGGRIGPLVPLVHLFSTAFTIGTGGSSGREGPIALIGAGVGSQLATRLSLSVRDRRIMMAAGMGAGVAAIFRVPLAGALFASEIFYCESDFETDVLIPAAISSVVAYSVYCLFLPADVRFAKLFGEQLDVTVGPSHLLALSLLALVLVGASFLFTKSLAAVRSLAVRLPGPAWLRPALGALLTGLVALVLFHTSGRGEDPRVLAVLSSGYGIIQVAISEPGAMGVGLLLVVALGKMLTTALTIGSGGTGGLFGPSIVIGGCLGAATGQLLNLAWPGLLAQQAFVVIGMAGFFAGVASAPFSTIVMVWEMTGHQSMLPGTMWVALLCWLLARRWRLFSYQVPTRLESPAHRGDFVIDILEGIKVADVYRDATEVELIHRGMTLDAIVHHLAETRQNYFPVIDAEGKMIGIFSASDVRAYLYDESIWSLTIAQDIMVSKFISLLPEDDLHTALQRFTMRNVDELPVLDPEDPGKLLGMLRRKEAIAVYNQRISELEKSREQEASPTLRFERPREQP